MRVLVCAHMSSCTCAKFQNSDETPRPGTFPSLFRSTGYNGSDGVNCIKSERDLVILIKPAGDAVISGHYRRPRALHYAPVILRVLVSAQIIDRTEA
jgi:hypothetical protein